MADLKVNDGGTVKTPERIFVVGASNTLFQVNYVIANNASQTPVTVWDAIFTTTYRLLLRLHHLQLLLRRQGTLPKLQLHRLLQGLTRVNRHPLRLTTLDRSSDADYFKTSKSTTTTFGTSNTTSLLL